MAGATFVNNTDSEIRNARNEANALVASREVTAASAASDLIASGSPLDAATEYVFWTLSGGTVRARLDGVAPTASRGHRIFAGDSGLWSRELALTVKIIREGSTDGKFEISEMVRK